MEPVPVESLRNQVVIRQFQPQDKEAVWDVSTKALGALGFPTQRGPQHADFNDIKGTYIDKNGDFLVGEFNGQIVAIGGYLQKDKETANIRRMRTLPEYQGKGIGKKLLEALEESIAKHGYKKIRLGTSTKMPNAIKLYAGADYQEVERTLKPESGFGADYAEIIYEKPI